MEIRTSDSHPIRLDVIDGAVVGVPGRLGMTFAPGKVCRSVQGYQWQRHLEQDMDRLQHTYGVTTIVCLIEAHEFPEMQIERLREQSVTRGMHFIGFPIADVSIPPDVEPFFHLIVDICRRLAAGETVLIHCKGGLGRTGIVAAACLMLLGMPAAEAVVLVRQVRPGTIETPQQERFVVSDFARRIQDRSEG